MDSQAWFCHPPEIQFFFSFLNVVDDATSALDGRGMATKNYSTFLGFDLGL